MFIFIRFCASVLRAFNSEILLITYCILILLLIVYFLLLSNKQWSILRVQMSSEVYSQYDHV